MQISILFFIISPALKLTTASSCSWLTPACLLAAGGGGRILTPDFRHPPPGSAAFAGCLRARSGAVFPAGEGSWVLTCCLPGTCALATWSCKTKHCWSVLSPDIHRGQQNAAGPTELGASVCHQTAMESFGRSSCWQEVIYGDTYPGPSQTEPTDASGSRFRSGLNAARSVLPALTASSASAAGAGLLGSSVWGQRPEARRAPRLRWARSGSVAAPSQACPAGSVNPLCVRCDPLHQDLLSLCSESFGLNGGGGGGGVHQLKSKDVFFAVLESRCREGFLPALLASRWEGHAQCTHHSPQTLGTCGQALKPHSGVSGVQ